jgi:hypothetical protein
MLISRMDILEIFFIKKKMQLQVIYKLQWKHRDV